MKYRKKPVVIEAVLWNGQVSEWFIILNNFGVKDSLVGVIETLEGPMKVSYGDWIVRGIKGELYPCKPDIFAATYEVVEPRDISEGNWEAKK